MFIQAKGSGRKCGDGSSVGLFIPLPVHLAKKFPTLIPDDSSPSHVTLLYIGEVKEAKRQAALIDVLRQMCGRFYWTSAEARLGDIDHFDHGHRIVPHLRVEFSKDFSSFRRLLKQELEQAGFPVADSHVEYHPHVTLDYMDPEDEWKGPKPKGKWTFDQIEVWGLPDQVPKIQLGRPKMANHREMAMGKRRKNLILRISRLVLRCGSDREIYELPGGADLVYKTLGSLIAELGNISFDWSKWDPESKREIHEMLRISESVRVEIRKKENRVQQARFEAGEDYKKVVRDLAKDLAEGLGQLQKLELRGQSFPGTTQGIIINRLEDMIQRIVMLAKA